MKPFNLSQFIRRRCQDCEQVHAEESDEKNTSNVEKFSMMSNVTEDELKIVEVVNSIMTFPCFANEAASLLIRML